MKKQVGLIVGVVLITALAPAQNTNDQKEATPGSFERETVLDRKIQIEKEWVMPDYVNKLIEKPFVRVENNQK